MLDIFFTDCLLLSLSKINRLETSHTAFSLKFPFQCWTITYPTFKPKKWVLYHDIIPYYSIATQLIHCDLSLLLLYLFFVSNEMHCSSNTNKLTYFCHFWFHLTQETIPMYLLTQVESQQQKQKQTIQSSWKQALHLFF